MPSVNAATALLAPKWRVEEQCGSGLEAEFEEFLKNFENTGEKKKEEVDECESDEYESETDDNDV